MEVGLMFLKNTTQNMKLQNYNYIMASLLYLLASPIHALLEYIARITGLDYLQNDLAKL